LALQHLALEFKPYQQEEHRHQAVVDPQQQRLCQPGLAELHRHRQRQDVIVIGMQHRHIVGH
jgi:hypothetical protein